MPTVRLKPSLCLTPPRGRRSAANPTMGRTRPSDSDRLAAGARMLGFLSAGDLLAHAVRTVEKGCVRHLPGRQNAISGGASQCTQLRSAGACASTRDRTARRDPFSTIGEKPPKFIRWQSNGILSVFLRASAICVVMPASRTSFDGHSIQLKGPPRHPSFAPSGGSQ